MHGVVPEPHSGWTFLTNHARVLATIADNRVPEPNFLDGLRTQRVLDGIERSAKSRRWAKT